MIAPIDTHSIKLLRIPHLRSTSQSVPVDWGNYGTATYSFGCTSGTYCEVDLNWGSSGSLMECVPMGAIIIKHYHYTELYATLLWAKFHLVNTNFFCNNRGKTAAASSAQINFTITTTCTTKRIQDSFIVPQSSQEVMTNSLQKIRQQLGYWLIDRF